MASVINGSDNFNTANLGTTSGSKTDNGYAYLPNGLIIQWFKLGDVGATAVSNYTYFYNKFL